MPKKTFTPEQIVAKLRQIEVLMSQGKTVPQACKEVSDYFLHWNFAAITPIWGSAGPEKACSEVVCYVRCRFEGGAVSGPTVSKLCQNPKSLTSNDFCS